MNTKKRALGKTICFVLNQLLMLFCNVLFFMGTFEMHELQRTNVSPVVGISMIWVYGIGYVVSIVMGTFNVHMLWRLVTGRVSEDEMIQVVEAEGLKDAEVAIKSVQEAKPT